MPLRKDYSGRSVSGAEHEKLWVKPKLASKDSGPVYGLESQGRRVSWKNKAGGQFQSNVSRQKELNNANHYIQRYSLPEVSISGSIHLLMQQIFTEQLLWPMCFMGSGYTTARDPRNP